VGGDDADLVCDYDGVLISREHESEHARQQTVYRPNGHVGDDPRDVYVHGHVLFADGCEYAGDFQIT
jgi:hypothetical protein